MVSPEEAEQQALLILAHSNHYKELRKHSFFKVHDQVLSDDLVQDTFIKTWNYLLKGGKIEIMKAFLYHILNDLIIDEYRKQKPISLDTLIENGFEPTNTDPERVLNLFDGKIAVLLIKYLPDKYRNIIHMRYVQDLSLEEISLITGQTRNTVAVQVHRGVEKLKILYEHKS